MSKLTSSNPCPYTFHRFLMRDLRPCEALSIIADFCVLLTARLIEPSWIFQFSIMMLSDIGIISLHWHLVKKFQLSRQYGFWNSSHTLGLRVLTIVAPLVFSNSTMVPNTASVALVYYVASGVAFADLLRATIYVMNRHDKSWLANTQGKLGLPNLISLIRIPLALLAPHILVFQPFGAYSSAVALSILALAILSDSVDGFIARHTHQITKLGKALDPLGDKFILYPSCLAVILSGIGMESRLASFALGIVVLRDVGVIAWWCFSGRKTKRGVSAGLGDKLRMVAICFWVFTGTLAIAFANKPDLSQQLATLSTVGLYVSGVMSIFALLFDIKRLGLMDSKEQ